MHLCVKWYVTYFQTKKECAAGDHCLNRCIPKGKKGGKRPMLNIPKNGRFLSPMWGQCKMHGK
jgi:hypothetical protein